jgi:hypothetical protein
MRLFDTFRHHTGSFFVNTPVIIADDIARQIDDLPDRPTSPPAASYGCCAPPFEQFFVEARTEAAGQVVERGMLCSDITDRLDDGWSRYTVTPPEGTRWILQMDGFMQLNGRGLIQFAGHLWTHLDQDGRILDDTNEMTIGEVTGVRLDEFTWPGSQMVNFYPFVMKAISALHRRCEVQHVTPTRQQTRLAQRKQGVKSLTDYYVLKVRPVGKRYDFDDVGRPQPAAGKREHEVRGHFRYYSPERPLFGRISGMVWVPAHRRGEDTIGKIKKDYEVGGDDI